MTDDPARDARPREGAAGRPSLPFYLVGFVAPALVVLVVVLAFAAKAAERAAVGTPGGPVELDADLGPIPEFHLVDQTGAPLTRGHLEGKPWIAGFAFTRCSGPCPRLVATMADVDRRLAKEAVRLVTFSVDPEHDTPKVLATYAANFQADPARWKFATGEPAALKRLVNEGFHLPVVRADDPGVAPGEKVTHSTRLALISADGRLRGYYESLDAGSVGRLCQAAVREVRTAAGADARRSPFPPINALLNGTSALLLTAGYVLVRARRVRAHRWCMLGALAVSAIFLACYVAHHARHGSTPFVSQGWVRTAYFAVLLTHVVLAVPVVPLALLVAWHGYRDRLDRHVRLARVAFPIWLYVSVTGVAVYLLLYVVDRPGGLA